MSGREAVASWLVVATFIFAMGAGAWACARPARTGGPHPSVVSAPSAAASSRVSAGDLKLCGVDVFGTRLDEQQVLRLTGLPPAGGFVDNKKFEEASRNAVRRLQESHRFLYAHVAAVTYYGDSGPECTYVTVDVVDDGDNRRMPFFPAPAETLVDPGGLVAAWRRYEAQYYDLLEHGHAELAQPTTCRAVHCLSFAHPDLANYDAFFGANVPGHKSSLIEILRREGDETKRAAAAFLLAYAGSVKEIAEATLPSLRDPSAAVRNAVMRVLVAGLELMPSETVPLRPFLEALDFPDTTDRNKAAIAILFLTQREEGARTLVLQQAGAVLVDMIRLKQPNNHDPARLILQSFAGRNLGEDASAWAAWLREQEPTLDGGG